MLSDLLAQPEGRAPLRRASQRPDPHQIEHPVHVTRRDEMHRAAHRPRAHCLTPLQRRGHLVDRESGQPNPERPQAAGQILCLHGTQPGDHPGHISRLLRRWQWSRQKPVRRARQRNAAAIQEWRQQRYPALRKRGRG